MNLCWSQTIEIVNELGIPVNDALVIDNEGNVAGKTNSNNIYTLDDLTTPIKVFAYGYNNFEIQERKELPKSIILKTLSDSLNTVEIISHKINASVSLSKILNNTVEKFTPPEEIYQNFIYLLIGENRDTLAYSTGVISKYIGSKWHEKTESYYLSLSKLYLDSSQHFLLEQMWPTPFVFSQRGGFVTNLINKLKDSSNNTFEITLDSIKNNDSIKFYYFQGTNIYKRLFGRPHPSRFNFTATGTELSNAILDRATLERPFDYMGMKSYNTFHYIFSQNLRFFKDEFYTISFSSDDKKCPDCKESLILTDGRLSGENRETQFQTGYFNFWQFKDAAQRDSILPLLMIQEE